MVILFILLPLITLSNSIDLVEVEKSLSKFDDITQHVFSLVPEEIIHEFKKKTDSTIDEIIHAYINDPTPYNYRYGPNISSKILVFKPKYNSKIKMSDLTNKMPYFRIDWYDSPNDTTKCTLYRLNSSRLWNKVIDSQNQGRILNITNMHYAYITIKEFGLYCIACLSWGLLLSKIVISVCIIILLN